jgi:DNA-directed RNA polymerase specialized sigma24 family protein
VDPADIQDRELFELAHARCWSYEAISAHLGIKVRTVGTRLHRAKLRIRAILEGEYLARFTSCM